MASGVIIKTGLLCLMLAACQTGAIQQSSGYVPPAQPYAPIAEESKALQILKSVHFPPFMENYVEPADPLAANYLNRARIIVFMPKDMASTAVEAQIKIDKIIYGALGEALYEQFAGKIEWKNRQTYVWNDVNRTFNLVDRLRFSVIAPGPCTSGTILCHYDYIDLPRETGTDAVISLFAPAILGGYPAWGFDYDAHSFLPLLTPSARQEKDGTISPLLPDDQVYRKMSKKLPEWIFIYLGTGSTSAKGSDGRYEFINRPVLLNQGEEVAF